MSNLKDGLRNSSWGFAGPALERIEQLERELAVQRNSICEDRFTIIRIGSELDAEKALADELGKRLEGHEVQGKLTFDAIALDRWRKARGL